ncbi:hypothetical protein HPC50_42375 [Corallococcus exiguus]|uniref:hypothetical protein n=1 Tax=Corallococcus TaxID=83461 RepID=UPI0011C34788|nr:MULTISPECIES: hypothetical protein [Corallococcus]NPC53682.1 hypothetical protein [Corallococcus exiguus]
MIKRTEDQDFIRFVASELVEDPHSSDVLSAAAKIVDEGGGAALFDALLAQVGLNAEGYELVRRIMLLLEAAMDVEPRVAGYLMAKLYPLASQKYAHDVYDAIGLWMSNSDSMALADVLMVLSAEPVRPLLWKSYQEWAEGIRRRASKKRSE